MNTTTLKEFIQYLLDMHQPKEKVRDFHVFILAKHDDNPELWALAYTSKQGGMFMWEHLFRLYQANQFSVAQKEESNES